MLAGVLRQNSVRGTLRVSTLRAARESGSATSNAVDEWPNRATSSLRCVLARLVVGVGQGLGSVGVHAGDFSRLSSASFVAMMKTSNLRKLHNLFHFWRLDASGSGSLLG